MPRAPRGRHRGLPNPGIFLSVGTPRFSKLGRMAVVVAALAGTAPALGDGDLPTKFTNQGSIANTRHNLTQSTIGAGAVLMNPYRNDYAEVCVYCHTPHGANATIAAPLWNRTNRPTTYQTYNLLGSMTLTEPVTAPGANSLTCLSCHDGTVAVDSIINMPGSGRYSKAQETAQDNAFLNAWNNASGPDATVHVGLNPVASQGCLACHAPGSIVGAGATDFTVFAIGTDLRDDHPVGVRYPQPVSGTDFRDPSQKRIGIAYFDRNGNARADPAEVRLYDTGDGYEVECASCHDPHGVPSGAPGSVFTPTFLRVANAGSALCLTCHVK